MAARARPHPQARQREGPLARAGRPGPLSAQGAAPQRGHGAVRGRPGRGRRPVCPPSHPPPATTQRRHTSHAPQASKPSSEAPPKIFYFSQPRNPSSCSVLPSQLNTHHPHSPQPRTHDPRKPIPPQTTRLFFRRHHVRSRDDSASGLLVHRQERTLTPGCRRHIASIEALLDADPRLRAALQGRRPRRRRWHRPAALAPPQAQPPRLRALPL